MSNIRSLYSKPATRRSRTRLLPISATQTPSPSSLSRSFFWLWTHSAPCSRVTHSSLSQIPAHFIFPPQQPSSRILPRNPSHHRRMPDRTLQSRRRPLKLVVREMCPPPIRLTSPFCIVHPGIMPIKPWIPLCSLLRLRSYFSHVPQVSTDTPSTPQPGLPQRINSP